MWTTVHYSGWFITCLISRTVYYLFDMVIYRMWIVCISMRIVVVQTLWMIAFGPGTQRLRYSHLPAHLPRPPPRPTPPAANTLFHLPTYARAATRATGPTLDPLPLLYLPGRTYLHHPPTPIPPYPSVTLPLTLPLATHHTHTRTAPAPSPPYAHTPPRRTGGRRPTG